MAPPEIDSLRNVVASLAITVPLAGSAVFVRMPRLLGVTSPPMVMVSVAFEAETERLPALSALAVPPERPASAVFSSAIVLTSPTPVPNVIVVVALPPTVTVSVWPCDTALCVSRLVALVVPADRPSSLNTVLLLAPPMLILVLASALVSTSLFDIGSTVAVTPAAAALIAFFTAVALSAGLIVIVVPLMTMLPPAELKLASDCEPVRTAAASYVKPAALPMILALALAPTTGLAEKFD